MTIFPKRITASPYDFSLPNMARLGWQRIVLSLRTLPTLRGWIETFISLAVSLAIGYYWTTYAGWYTTSGVPISWSWLSRFLETIWEPALFEELICRALLVPHLSETVTVKWRIGTILAALVFYVSVHPLRGLYKMEGDALLFLNWDFIVLIALLGIVCHVSYQRTGSIWPGTIIHAASVTGWWILKNGPPIA